jgi:serine/threonine protein kinase
MLGKFGETFVVDWGLARVNKNDSHIPEATTDESILVTSGSGSAATRLGATIGTLEYMSPEQAEGRLDSMGATADVFSLGATLYCILTGSYPVSSEKKSEGSRLDYGHFLKPSQINRAVPRALDAICLKALATEPVDRYQSAAEFVDELEAWLADEPVSAYVEPLSQRARRWLKRHRTWAASGAGAIAASLVALVGLLLISNNHNRELTQARDEAIRNETVARNLLSRELRIDQELLGRNELTAV